MLIFDQRVDDTAYVLYVLCLATFMQTLTEVIDYACVEGLSRAWWGAPLYTSAERRLTRCASRKVFGPFWTLLDPFGPFWTLLDPFGPFWTPLDPFGPFWTRTRRFFKPL